MSKRTVRKINELEGLPFYLAIVVALLGTLSLFCYMSHRKIDELNDRCEMLCNDKLHEQRGRIQDLEKLKKHFNLPALCKEHNWRHAWTNSESRPDHGGEDVRYCSWCGVFRKFKTPKYIDYGETLGPFEYEDMSGKSKEVE